MDTNEFDYYLVFAQSAPSVPAITLSDDSDYDDLDMIQEEIDADILEFEIDEPFPKKPVMVDFHDDGTIEVVSAKIYQALQSLNAKKMQLIPATIHDSRNDVTYDNYFYPHVYFRINCLNKEKSTYTIGVGGNVNTISKISLDTEVLSKIPLEERLAFRLGEMFTFQLFHKSVVDAIMATEPKGVRFVKVEDYHVGAAFD